MALRSRHAAKLAKTFIDNLTHNLMDDKPLKPIPKPKVFAILGWVFVILSAIASLGTWIGPGRFIYRDRTFDDLLYFHDIQSLISICTYLFGLNILNIVGFGCGYLHFRATERTRGKAIMTTAAILFGISIIIQLIAPPAPKKNASMPSAILSDKPRIAPVPELKVEKPLAITDIEFVRIEKKAKEGDAISQFNLGFMFKHGISVPKDNVTAALWYRRAADQNHAPAQSNLGMMYANGEGVAPDPAEAVRWYLKAGLQGNPPAQHNLGLMYATGRGVIKDDVAAMEWCRKAAEQGYALAQVNLGVIYADGQGIAKNELEAGQWYRMAAEQSNAKAQFNLGVMYANGRGVAKSDADAVEWYRRSAEQGNGFAQYNLGFMYANGRGVARNDHQAVDWYRKAAERGIAEAQTALGVAYATGRGLPFDPVEAYTWWSLAAANSDGSAQANLKKTTDRMTKEQLSLVREIVAKRTLSISKLKDTFGESEVRGTP